MKRVYLDYAATTPTHPDAVVAMKPYFNKHFGNPSSIHSFGQEGKIAIEEARIKIADLIEAKSDEIVFTSGGTEADNFALEGIAFANEHKGNHLITSLIEHHAVLECCGFLERHGFKVTYLPVDKFGLINPDDLRKAITDKTILVSIMHANNEIGTIEPISEIGKIVKERGIYFHTDAVQTFGHIPINVDQLNVDLLAISAHKAYGPKGVGALYIRKGTRIESFLHGGDQERKRRASTENVPGIVGFGKAVEIIEAEMEEEAKRVEALRNKLIDGVTAKIDGVVLNGHLGKRLPNNANFGFDFIEGEALLISLDMKGIAVSTGSACSSASLTPSHVLSAIGLSPEKAHGSIRFSLGKWTTEKEIDYVLKVLPQIVSRLRSMSPLYKGKKEKAK